MPAKRLHIRLCYVSPKHTIIKDIVVPLHTTIKRALSASGLLSLYPQMGLDKMEIGVYGRRRPMNTLLHDGDRIEFYRPVNKNGKKRILPSA